MTPLDIFNAVFAVMLAALRMSGHKSQFFQAVAHIFVGWIFTHAYAAWSGVSLTIGVAVSLVELACAIYFKAKGSP